MEQFKRRYLDNRHRVLVLFHVVWATGLLLPISLGVLAREMLKAQDVAVVSWSEGSALVFLLAIWIDIPFLVLAVLTRKILVRTILQNPNSFSLRFWIAVGAFIAVTLTNGYMLWILYVGPRFAEAVIMTMYFSFITIPYLVLQSAVAALVGGVIAWLVSWVANKLRNGGKEAI